MDPGTGEIKEILTWREENGKTILPLHLGPEGSVFVVFKESAPQKHVTGIRKDGKNLFHGNRFETKETPFIELYKRGGKNFSAVYEPGIYDLKWGGAQKIEINELKSWIKFEEPGVKYYSGTARYDNSFSLNAEDIKGNILVLDLGNILEMASVKINGQLMPVVWSAAFRFDITAYAKAGTNELEVEVVNMWPN